MSVAKVALRQEGGDSREPMLAMSAVLDKAGIEHRRIQLGDCRRFG